MSFASDPAESLEQLTAALGLAVEAQLEAGRLLNVASVMLRRRAGLQEEAEEMTDRDDGVDSLEDVNAGADPSVTEAPVERGGISLLPAGQSMPNGTARMSAPRFRAITGLSTDEFRILAGLPDEEFAKAQSMGFTVYLRGPVEVAPVSEPPVASAPTPAPSPAEPTSQVSSHVPAPVGASRFERTMQEFTELAGLQAAE